MGNYISNPGFCPKVAVARLPSCSYPSETKYDGVVSHAISRLGTQMGWSNESGPFGKLISSGARVLIKPNLVLHRNEGTGGMECLITHPSVIRAAVLAALRAPASEVLVGDAPIQGCDFDALSHDSGLEAWSQELMSREPRFKGIRDFRRTKCVLVKGVRIATENLHSLDQFTLFDLGKYSLLESISDGQNRFRVTQYDPRLMAGTHRPGLHQYLVAKEVMDADVIINLPKLKTHKKAGITCALKNLIGINGNKEYLPHHRVGGSESGGDCYPGKSFLKSALENIADRQNQTSSYVAAKFWQFLAVGLARTSRLQGDRIGTDGSWSGNDTIWRTCLDLNRILLYGRSDGSMSDDVQRVVAHLADAVVAGQGNGPLAPDPLQLGLILAANNAAALDWVGARLLGYDALRIPLLRHAFDQFHWRITDSPASAVRVIGDLGEGCPEAVIDPIRQAVKHPLGWRNSSITQPAEASHPDESLLQATASTNPWDA